MPGSLEERYIRFEVISGKNLKVTSQRIPADIYISINVDSRRRWKSSISVLSSDESVTWGNTSLVDSEISRDTDAGHAQFAEYTSSRTVSHLNDAVQHFQSVLDRRPVDHPDHAAALTNLAPALRPQGHPDRAPSIYNLITALIFRYSSEPTAVYIHESAQLCYKLLPLCREGTYLHSVGVDSAVDYVIPTCNNLPIDASDEGIHLRRNVLEFCPMNAHNSVVKLSLCLMDILTNVYLNDLALSLVNHQGKLNDLDEAICFLGVALIALFHKRGDIDDIIRAISLYREALTLYPPGHPHHDTTPSNLALALKTRYVKLHVSEDLNEAIDRYRESLQLMRHDYPERRRILVNLSSVLCSRFTHTRKNEDVVEAITLCQESLAALHALHPHKIFSYWWLQVAYQFRYQILHDPADLLLAMDNLRLASGHDTYGFPEHVKAA
ncbi:hypothetical protein DFJ58DRAFT_734132 [Suillus subalutaceus]|uniref:uncharacterized protein n=1 Tax=Suillus subalutaceus TaxID=48586 RepID=UPI001B8788B6|nr:uncharacterized protein DFJ58DRAFT_734132 [Suillus subalutaceus]KAG1837843.1 hypothetical protein DFJ58DRAFT_734132 [Suillus subalutaceus]